MKFLAFQLFISGIVKHDLSFFMVCVSFTYGAVQIPNGCLGWVGVDFNGPVNTNKVMLSGSVYLTTLVLGKLSPLTSTCAHSFARKRYQEVVS